jgi:hypothetical protein
MGEVISLLAAFLTDIGNRRAVSGAEVLAARKSRRGLSVPDPPVISLPHQLSPAFTLNRISWRETESF